MSRNIFAAVDKVENLTGRKFAPIQRLQFCEVGRRFRLKACKRPIPFAADAVTTDAIPFIRHLASAGLDVLLASILWPAQKIPGLPGEGPGQSGRKIASGLLVYRVF